MPHLDSLGFTPNYECELDPEFPGNGDWGMPTYSFSRDGRPHAPFRSTWGTPLVARIRRTDGVSWVGSVESGGIGSAVGAFGCPNPDALCLILGGQAFHIDTRRPESYQVLLPDVREVRHFPALDLLLLATQVDLAAVGTEGHCWTTARLCLDELRLVSASPAGIVCAGYLDREERFVISPRDGSLLSGPVCPY